MARPPKVWYNCPSTNDRIFVQLILLILRRALLNEQYIRKDIVTRMRLCPLLLLAGDICSMLVIPIRYGENREGWMRLRMKKGFAGIYPSHARTYACTNTHMCVRAHTHTHTHTCWSGWRARIRCQAYSLLLIFLNKNFDQRFDGSKCY